MIARLLKWVMGPSFGIVANFHVATIKCCQQSPTVVSW